MARPFDSYRPTIGITTQTLHSIDGIPPALPSSWVMNQRYFLAATLVGAVPWMIPLLDDDMPTLREIYERLDGLLIPGGVDINPSGRIFSPYSEGLISTPPGMSSPSRRS